MNVCERVKRCYGCGACENICPFGAVSVKEDASGFLKAVIDKEKCTDCGKCLTVCPQIINSFENTAQPECYGAWAEDNIRCKCASGGIYTAIAREMIQRGGWIAGVVWKKDFRTGFILTKTEEELDRIGGSKYVQSAMGKTYLQIREKLEKGEQVLFSGCPCQVAGLFSFLGKKYDGLYTIDLICHGVSSSKVLVKYLQDEYDYPKIERIDFRDKTVFGWSTEMNVYFTDDVPIRKRASEDSFYKAFLNNMCLNSVCEECQFSKLPRQGDISLGDFWNIEKYDPGLNDRKGTSLVLINNEKGEQLFHDCKLIVKKEKIPLTFVRQTCNRTVFEPFRHHYARDRFFREFSNKKFDTAVNMCLTFHYDIGLVTTWFARNFGAIFTAWALYKKLEEMGYSVLMINKPKELWETDYFSPDRNRIALDFGRRNYNLSKEYGVNQTPELNLLNNSCDIFMLGSDQLWNPKIYAHMYYFFLDFVTGRHKKISYATSIGADHFEGTEDDKYVISYLLSRFDQISVREIEAVRVCEDTFDFHPAQVLDPVFLPDDKMFNNMADSVEKNIAGEFIFAYILDGNIEKRNLINQVAEKYHLPVWCAYDIEHPEMSRHYLQLKEADIKKPEDWLWYIKNSRYVITDSYHGGCFSIIFHKKFICIANVLRGKGRFQELLGKLGLDRHLITDLESNSIKRVISLIDDFNYSKADKILKREKERSLHWLKTSLAMPKEQKMSSGEYAAEMLLPQIDKMNKEINDIKEKVSCLNVYGDIWQLGLSKGCKVQDIIDKLPDNSYFQQVQGSLGSPVADTPVPYGVLTIKRTTDYFVEVQFVQMTYSSKKPQIYIANVVNKKIAAWEQFVSLKEYDERIEKIEKEFEITANKLSELEKKINILNQ